MKVQCWSKHPGVEFRTLEKGDAFMIGGTVIWMKTEPVMTDSGKRRNCVCINTGGMAYIEDDAIVDATPNAMTLDGATPND